jgi:hypothetical protein
MTCRLLKPMGYGMGYGHHPEFCFDRMKSGADERT